MTDWLPSSATSVGVAALTSISLAALGTPLLPVVAVGSLAGFFNYSKDVADAITDAESTPTMYENFIEGAKWYLNLLWKGGAILIVFFVIRYIRNMYRQDRKTAEATATVVAPVVAPAPVVTAPIVDSLP